MAQFVIGFWRDGEHVFDYEGEEYRSIEDARHQINELLQEMINDPSGEDWTGCRFEVATGSGKKMLDVPVLAALSAIARKKVH